MSIGQSAYNLARSSHRFNVAMFVGTVVAVVSWLAAFLPLVLDLNAVWIAETVFAVVIFLAGALFFFSTSGAAAGSGGSFVVGFFGLTLIIAFIAAVLGACLDTQVNVGCFGYEVFATVWLTLPALFAVLLGFFILANGKNPDF